MNFTGETEQKIIRAATEVFLHRGKDGARMQEIADRAGINKALLHYYFRSKDRLYQKVFETTVKSVFDEFLDAILETEDPVLFIKGFIENYIDALSRRPEMIRFIIWEIDQGGEQIGRMIQSIFSERGFSEIPIPLKIQQAIGRGQIRQVDPIQLTLSLIGMCLHPFLAERILEKLFQEISVTSPGFLEARKKEVFDLVWKGIRPEGGA